MLLQSLAQAIPLLLVTLHRVRQVAIIDEVEIEVIHRRVPLAHGSQLRRLYMGRAVILHCLHDGFFCALVEAQDLMKLLLLAATLASTSGLVALRVHGSGTAIVADENTTRRPRCGSPGILGPPGCGHTIGLLVERCPRDPVGGAQAGPMDFGGGEGCPGMEARAEGLRLRRPARRAGGGSVVPGRVLARCRGAAHIGRVAVPRNSAHPRICGVSTMELAELALRLRRHRCLVIVVVPVAVRQLGSNLRWVCRLPLRSSLQNREVLEVFASENYEVIDLVGHWHLRASATLCAE
mmetsp:Transcript_42414/g.95737  ORF Transcript_42414/g.95737 Transcript_42414/m.95737 type:complete len:294 (-) Transcript_42414:285-1166(-)